MEVRLGVHGAYHHQYHVEWIPKYRRHIFRVAIKIFVQEHLSQIKHYHPDVLVQPWTEWTKGTCSPSLNFKYHEA